IENTNKIAEMVNIEIPLGVARFPVFQTPEGKSSMEYLREMTYQKAEGKLKLIKEDRERLEYELSVIEKKKYADYFLVVWDFMEWAHLRGIITNTRGSAAGSLVLYCLGVTNLNPLDYLLPFERFLTVDRPTLPDIDADLADDRRDDVIRYVMKKYGEDRGAHIVTFGTMMGRAALRDIGRVMGMGYGEVDSLAKLVPPPHQGFHKPLHEVVKEVLELAGLYASNPQVKKLFDLAMKIEGTVRHASVHAAGIVISPEEITHFTPLQKEANGDKVVCQYDMFSVEDAGLVKMDFLGIRNLSILGRAVEYVRQNRGVDIDLNKINIDDKKAYDLLARGETMGIFQLSSEGMTKYLMELRPTNIPDLAAMVALYRPGPLGVIPEYISRKRDPKLIKYYDPRMQSYMQQSLGLLVYQEDVLYSAINIAGYSWEDADKFRKAMGKKIPAEMEKQKGKFVEGCVKNGMDQKQADDLFALIAPFAAYGFNKSHAASYAMVAYHTAYMKANYPVEFMAAVMTAEYGDADKIANAIEECKKMGIPVLPPDINKSFVGFTIEKLSDLSKEELVRQIGQVKNSKFSEGIRFGLSAIKNVGVHAIESIIEGRKEKPFIFLMDLLTKVDTRLCNKKTMESLIKAGALDHLGSRSAQLMSLEECLEEAHKLAKASMGGQVSLFDGLDSSHNEIKFELPDVEELPLEQLLSFEKELLGFYLHEPPYIKDLRKIKEFISTRISEFDDSKVGEKIVVGGVLSEVKKVLTKKDASEMAFLRVFDGSGEIECVVFPKLYAVQKKILLKEQVVVMWGRLDKRDDNFSLVIDNIDKFDPSNFPVVDISTGSVRKGHLKEVEIEFPRIADSELLKRVHVELKKYPGTSPISILIPSGNTLKKMDLSFRVNPGNELIKSVESILGSGSIRLI
ncbi:MAG: polymerase III, alpha subunit protein, partial [Candidatus Daviesbacteria bacterium GW2011_GWA1_38_7]